MTRYWPMQAGHIVTSGFGPRWGTVHRGTDFGWPGGSGGRPVYACDAGVVRSAGASPGFGGPSPAGLVTIQHEGWFSGYGHIVCEVKPGERVAAGQRIGRVNPDMATAGDSTAPHLHLFAGPGTYDYAKLVDPIPLLSGAAHPGGDTVPPQFQADLLMLTNNDSGPRDPRTCLWAVVHTFEGNPQITARDMAAYQQKPESGGSYTIVVDRQGTTARENDDNYIPWAAAQTGNRFGLHVSLAGRAAQTRAEWLAQDRQLRALARVLADWSNRYSIPLIKLTPDAVRTKRTKGVCGHHDISLAFGETDHTDPGPHFPWDTVLDYARGSTTPTPSKETAMTPEQDKMLREIHAALVGTRHPSRVQGSTYTGTGIDYILNTNADAYRLAKALEDDGK